MSFNGSGVFVRLYNWVNDAAASVKIRADRMDAEMNGFATGLSTCITKDGQTTVTANLPMAGFKHTNVANASASNEYAAYGQLTTALAAITLDSLSDVVLTSTASGNFIYYNGTNWVNVAKDIVPVDGLKATGSGGIALKNSAGTTVLTAGASAGTAVTCAGAVTISGAATLSSTLAVTGVSTFTGRVDTAASATGGAGVRIPHGTAPTSPTNGDVWTTTSGIFARINGTTKQLNDQTISKYTSSNQTITAGGLLTLPHGLSVTPKFIQAYYVCTTTDGGWAVNDEVLVNPASYDGGTSYQATNDMIYADATNIYVRMAPNNPLLGRKDTGAAFAITSTSWAIKIYALNI